MRKSIKYLTPLGILLIGAITLKIFISAPDEAIEYLSKTPKSMDIVSAHQFVQFRDKPAYSGQLAPHDAEKLAREAKDTEANAWASIDRLGFRLLSESKLSRCVSDVHERKMDFLSKAISMSTAPKAIVKSKDVEDYFQWPERLLALEWDCRAVAHEAALWPKLRSLFGRDSSNANFPAPGSAQSTSVPASLPTLYADLPKLEFTSLSVAEKSLLQEHGIPTSDAEVTEGFDSHLHPAVIKVNGSSDRFLLAAANSTSARDDSTTFYSIFNLTNPSEVQIENLTGEENGRVYFILQDGALTGIVKVEMDEPGTKGAVGCKETGTIYRLDERTMTLLGSQSISLDSECPSNKNVKEAEKALSPTLPDVLTQYEEQRETTFKALANKMLSKYGLLASMNDHNAASVQALVQNSQPKSQQPTTPMQADTSPSPRNNYSDAEALEDYHLAARVAQDIKENGPEQLRQLDLATIQSAALSFVTGHRARVISDEQLARMGGIRGATERSLIGQLAVLNGANRPQQ